MISYYKYWQAIGKLEESLKTVNAMQPDVPDMIMAQYEMDLMIMDHWKEKAEKFTKKMLIILPLSVILSILYVKGYINV